MSFFNKRKKFIYGLRKLNTSTIVYVGQSYEPESRLVKHIKDAKTNRHTNIKLSNWILNCLKMSTIVIEILEIIDEDKANDCEKFWILKMNKKSKLFNMADPTRPYSKTF